MWSKHLVAWAQMRDFGSYGSGLLPVMRTAALRRNLNSVPPETPIRDIVDRCRVWESHTDTGIWRIVKPTPERALPVYTVDEPVCMPADWVVTAVMAPPVGLERLHWKWRLIWGGGSAAWFSSTPRTPVVVYDSPLPSDSPLPCDVLGRG